MFIHFRIIEALIKIGSQPAKKTATKLARYFPQTTDYLTKLNRAKQVSTNTIN